MRHVNFLQLEMARSIRFELNYFWILFAIGFLALVTISLGSFQQYRLSAVLRAKEAVTAEVTNLRSSKNAEEKNAEIRRVIQTVLNRPVTWTPILNKIARRVPSSIRLAEMSGSLDQNRALKLKGVAQTLPRIFELKANLELIKDCEKIVLLNLSQIEDPLKEKGISFEMECRIQ